MNDELPPAKVRLTDGLGINWAAERAEFERWYLETQTAKNYKRVAKHEDTGAYIDFGARVSWRAWQLGVKRAIAGKVAVGSPVERKVRRPLGMPEYTDEQKAAAFDALWETCGMGQGLLKDWVSRNISRPDCPPNEATMLRVPRYEFMILAEGEMHRFRDVLHHLATRIQGA